MDQPLRKPGRATTTSDMNPYRIVLVDDDALFRHSLKKILQENRNLEVTGEAGNGEELLELLDSAGSTPDLVVIDISMPGIGGIETTVLVKRSHPGLKVLILSMHKEKEYVQGALTAGANGYALKEDSDIEVFAAIEKIRRGGTYISPLLAEENSPIGEF